MKMKNKKINKSKSSENFIEKYCHFVYKNFGRKLLDNKKFKSFFKNKIYNKRYDNILKKANLKLIPEEYFLTIFISIFSILLISVVLSFIYLFINPIFYLLFLFGGIFVLCFVGIFLYNYPLLLAKKRGNEIKAAIPYILPYMKILAKELNLSKIISIIEDFIIYKEMKIEFERINYYSNVLGYDIHSSIRETMISCPCRDLSDMMNDLVTISNSGGSIYSYLDRKLNNLNLEIDALEKKSIETLLIYSQIYVVLLLIAPLFFTIMTSILSLINFSTKSSTVSSGFSSISSIVILLFVLPFLYVGFMFLIYFSKPLYSRLKPL